MWPKDPLIRIEIINFGFGTISLKKKSILKEEIKEKKKLKSWPRTERTSGEGSRFCYLMQPWGQTEEIESVYLF